MNATGTRILRSAKTAGVLALLLAGACKGDGAAPTLEPVDDQIAVVGQELVVNLRATDPDGDALDFQFDAPIEGIGDVAEITRRPDGTAVFRWTPLGEDLGTWFFDFTVSDRDGKDTVTVVIDVRATGGEGSAPIFREPLGSGTTLDLERAACLDVPIVIEDQDSTDVSIGQGAPQIEGGEVVQSTGLTGTWSWCPSKAQVEEDRYPLVLTADDGNNPAVKKNYLIVLRQAPKSDCPGEAPEVIHSPRNWEDVLDVEIVADVSDDVGLKRAPLLYYTLDEPKAPIDFAAFDVKEMEVVEGDMVSGRWRATIPNPVASQPEGTSVSLWYIISVADNDDAEGDCDHLTDAPMDGAFGIMVINGGGGGGAGLCEPCSADAQCGEADDLCAVVGSEGETVCLAGCATSDECEATFSCIEVTSVDGASARQCVPQSGTCEDDPLPECEDDASEDNDTLAQATAGPALGTGSHALVSCPDGPGDDEDWFRIVLAGDTTITLGLDGGNATDLDLQLVGSGGAQVAASAGPGSDEQIMTCLGAGTYYARVSTAGSGENSYTLSYSTSAGSCGGSCQDDDQEQDDTFDDATYAEVFPDAFSVADRQICAGDDDYYRVELFTGETLVVDLTFTQTSGDEDLDLHFFSPSMVDLTPCSETNPGTCTTAQGQSATSNEHYEHTVADAGCSPCDFWVMVHGWDDAENTYDLTMGLE
jgi:hypothetical protein